MLLQLVSESHFDNNKEPVKGLLTYLKPHLLNGTSPPVLHSLIVLTLSCHTHMLKLRKVNAYTNVNVKDKERGDEYRIIWKL